ncbi:MAG TPA: hypothetical protein VN679_15310 [Candidatus Acidoferrales bacterium]|nr:hypothetical protein [Candidatus Acidoferrales bacterium]
MSNVNVKTITIEASSREEALAELKAKLGDEVPADVLEFVVSKFEEHAKDKDHGELLIDTKARTVEEIDIHAEKMNAIDNAKHIANLPPEKRLAAMRDYVLELGRKFGFSEQETLDKANATRRKVNSAFEAMGVKVPAGLDGMFDTNNVKEDGESHSETAAKFDNAIKQMRKAGFSDDALNHIGWFYNAQDDMVNTLVNLFKVGGFGSGHNHVPSAKLFQQMDDYLKCTNEMVYGCCKHAGVDPRDFGFLPESEWRSRYNDMAPVRECIQETINNG